MEKSLKKSKRCTMGDVLRLVRLVRRVRIDLSFVLVKFVLCDVVCSSAILWSVCKLCAVK